MSTLDHALALLDAVDPVELRGTLTELRGLAVHAVDLPLPVGASAHILPRGVAASDPARIVSPGQGDHPALIPCEVVGFARDQTILMPLAPLVGVRPGDPVVAHHHKPIVRVGASLLGRVLNGLGEPIDGKGPLHDTLATPLVPRPLDPLDRPLIDRPLATGVRAIDAMTSVGRGQRLGVFASPGLGKSTLLATMARHTSADVSVIALVGERGREVRDFIDKHLGQIGMSRCVVVCATGDEPAVLRIRAALVSAAVAEHFRDQGLDVLWIVDSVTRFCHAQRQVGLAAGEPPATKGYPPSVFSLLPTVLERAGRTTRGSVTGFFAVLVDGDDLSDPIADAARGILDGHVILSRKLANRNHWPAIDILQSISRVADDVTDPEHQSARRLLVKLLDAYQQIEELLNIGAYAAGSNPDADLAIACKPVIDQFLQQGRSEVQGAADFERTRKQLLALGQQIKAAQNQIARMKQHAATPQGPQAPKPRK